MHVPCNLKRPLPMPKAMLISASGSSWHGSPTPSAAATPSYLEPRCSCAGRLTSELWRLKHLSVPTCALGPLKHTCSTRRRRGRRHHSPPVPPGPSGARSTSRALQASPRSRAPGQRRREASRRLRSDSAGPATPINSRTARRRHPLPSATGPAAPTASGWCCRSRHWRSETGLGLLL